MFLQEVETIPPRPWNYSLWGLLITLHLGNEQRYFREEGPLERSFLRVSSQNYLSPWSTKYARWCTIEKARPQILAVTVLQNPPVTTRIRDMNPKDGYLGNIHKYFCVASEDPSSVVSAQLLFYIRDRPDHRLRIPTDSTVIRELLHELHDVLFAAPAKVYGDLRSNLYLSKMKQEIETYVLAWTNQASVTDGQPI